MAFNPSPDGTQASGTANVPLTRSDTVSTIAVDDDMEQATQSLVSLTLNIPGAWPKDKKAKRAKRTRSIRTASQHPPRHSYNLRSMTGRPNPSPHPSPTRVGSRLRNGAFHSTIPSRTPPSPMANPNLFNTAPPRHHHRPTWAPRHRRLSLKPDVPTSKPAFPSSSPARSHVGPSRSMMAEELLAEKERLRAEERERLRKEREDAARAEKDERIRKAGEKLDERERKLDERGRRLDEMGRKLHERGRRLEKREAASREKERFLYELEERLTRMRAGASAEAAAEGERERRRAEEARRQQEEKERARAEAEAKAQEEARRRAEEHERNRRQYHNQAEGNQSSQPGTNAPLDRLLAYWQFYNEAWKSFLVVPPPNLLCSSPDDVKVLLSEKAIADFIFAPAILGSTTTKKRLQEVVLRFHPDKFSRWQHWIADTDVEAVRDLCNATTNHLNALKSMV